MASQRTTFGKRQREQNRKDRLLAKQQRLATRRAEARQLRDAPPSTDVVDGALLPDVKKDDPGVA